MFTELFFKENPVFRYEEFVRWRASQGNDKRSSASMALAYYIKTGRICLLRRQQYAVIPLGEKPRDFVPDPYLVAATAADNAVLGYHTALELMGLAYSKFSQYTYLTVNKRHAFQLYGNQYVPSLQPTMLRKTKTTFKYTQMIEYQNMQICVTNPARTFVDVLDRIELSGGWEEVVRSINKIAVLNVDEVIDYCLLLAKANLTAKVGYFLSQRKGAFVVSEKKLSQLEGKLPKRAEYVSRNSKEPFVLVRDWNIFLPKSVIEQSWEEPNAID